MLFKITSFAFDINSMKFFVIRAEKKSLYRRQNDTKSETHECLHIKRRDLWK